MQLIPRRKSKWEKCSDSNYHFSGVANMSLGGYRSTNSGIWRKANFSRSSPAVASGSSLQNPAAVRAASVATQQRKRAIQSNKNYSSNKETVKSSECVLGANINRRMSNP